MPNKSIAPVTQQEISKSITIHNNHPVISTLEVAKHFGKRHTDVLRAIKKLDISEDFGERNFALSSYLSEQGKSLQSYNLTKDGFILLVMGFTGKPAMELKIKFIEAFNQLQNQLIELKSENQQRIESKTISPNQQRLVRLAVSIKAERAKTKYNKIYREFYDRYKIPSYKSLPVEYFNDAMRYLGSPDLIADSKNDVVEPLPLPPNVFQIEVPGTDDGFYLFEMKNAKIGEVHNFTQTISQFDYFVQRLEDLRGALDFCCSELRDLENEAVCSMLGV